MKIPCQEKIVMQYVFDGAPCYTVTRNPMQKYTLYKINYGDYRKLKTSDSPIDFDKIVKKDREN